MPNYYDEMSSPGDRLSADEINNLKQQARASSNVFSSNVVNCNGGVTVLQPDPANPLILVRITGKPPKNKPTDGDGVIKLVNGCGTTDTTILVYSSPVFDSSIPSQMFSPPFLVQLVNRAGDKFETVLVTGSDGMTPNQTWTVSRNYMGSNEPAGTTAVAADPNSIVKILGYSFVQQAPNTSGVTQDLVGGLASPPLACYPLTVTGLRSRNDMVSIFLDDSGSFYWIDASSVAAIAYNGTPGPTCECPELASTVNAGDPYTLFAGEIRRPYGGASVGSIAGSLFPKIGGQRLGGSPPPIFWTHILVCDASFDIRDGCSRIADTAQLAFGMGDEVRYPGGNTPQVRFAVAYVERDDTIKRVYLCRDAVDWANGGVI